MTWVREHVRKGVIARQTLSAHATTVCQPRKASGPSGGSLKDWFGNTLASRWRQWRPYVCAGQAPPRICEWGWPWHQ
eukprot:6495197-Lingulodinium_polyedra.AAC.1